MILDFDYITMGQRIKQRRKELNMTQADNLTLCDDTSVELTRRFTELLVELYPNKSNQK